MKSFTKPHEWTTQSTIVQTLMPEFSEAALQQFSDLKEARFREVAGTLTTPLLGFLT